MSISIASSFASAYNEPVQAQSLFPDYIRDSSLEIVRLIRLYYEYLNSEGQASQEIARMIENHDIDAMSDKYLSAIQLQIAKSVPESIAMDKRRLYKIIAQYYKQRGSDHSVQSFFKIFFNEFVSIFYPSSRLFDTSGDKSKSSDDYVLQDGVYWQKYSYEIKTENNPSVWKEAFLKFVHPAGLRLFLAVLVIMYADNTWEGPLSEYINDHENLNQDEYWENLKLEAIIYKYNSKFQPNIYYEIDYLFKVIYDSNYHYQTNTYDIDTVSNADLFASMLIILFELILVPESQTSLFRSAYQSWLKTLDTAMLQEGYIDYTEETASAPYNPVNDARFEALAPYIQKTDPNYIDSFFTEDGSLSSDWDESYYSEDENQLQFPLKNGYVPDILVNEV